MNRRRTRLFYTSCMTKVQAYFGGTTVANQLWTANQSAWVRVPSISSRDIFIQAGVTTVLSTDPLYQNTNPALWTMHTVEEFG